MDEAAAGQAKPRSFRFVLTGFGPFQDIPDNPTSVLARELQTYVEHRRAAKDSIVAWMEEAGRSQDHITLETVVVETSAQAARAEIANLQRKLLSDAETAGVILLHLGVSAALQHFHLETAAYNVAAFRCPDERGYQPSQTPIVDDSRSIAVGGALTTTFDVPALVEELNQTATADPTGKAQALASSDPGRFVCNFLYCCSLDTFGSGGASPTVPQGHLRGGAAQEPPPIPHTQSLFLHVPPFTTVSKEDQLVFVVRLMGALYQQRQQAGVAVASE
jgi:pyroglutamyl-peptidase